MMLPFQITMRPSDDDLTAALEQRACVEAAKHELFYPEHLGGTIPPHTTGAFNVLYLAQCDLEAGDKWDYNANDIKFAEGPAFLKIWQFRSHADNRGCDV